VADDALARGSSAKLYCLEKIDELAAARDSVTVLDLGCGDGSNFVGLLRRRGNVRYVGVDPSGEAIERARSTLAGLNAEVVRGLAYDVRVGPADVVVSFSVLEHVYRRRLYLDAARENLAPDGIVLMNYDAGHFAAFESARGRLVERWKGRIGAVLARLGHEGKYQSLVRESTFRLLVADARLRIVEERVFNTDLKRVYRLVPEERRAEYMTRWLDFELYLNTLGIEYRDELASMFRTRNFVLAHASTR
jgi:SAM-dependent methyltransferase